MFKASDALDKTIFHWSCKALGYFKLHFKSLIVQGNKFLKLKKETRDFPIYLPGFACLLGLEDDDECQYWWDQRWLVHAKKEII